VVIPASQRLFQPTTETEPQGPETMQTQVIALNSSAIFKAFQ